MWKFISLVLAVVVYFLLRKHHPDIVGLGVKHDTPTPRSDETDSTSPPTPPVPPTSQDVKRDTPLV